MKINFLSDCFLKQYFLSGNKNGSNFWLNKPNFHYPKWRVNRRVIGALLFTIGIVVALISAAKLPATGTVSDMLPLYMSAVALSLVGLLLLRCSCLEKKKMLNMSIILFLGLLSYWKNY